MIVVDKKELRGGARDVSGSGWSSLRLLVKTDDMGFSMTETLVHPGTELNLQYLNHVEACYCISGAGTVTESETGKVHRIAPGVLYAPNANDRHELRVHGDNPLHLICVFLPALKGDEVHGPDGSYSA